MFCRLKLFMLNVILLILKIRVMVIIIRLCDLCRFIWFLISVFKLMVVMDLNSRIMMLFMIGIGMVCSSVLSLFIKVSMMVVMVV